jgi:3-oxoacyl-[acyl-carrier protein] reductase
MIKLDFSGKVAIVTGGSRGIGKAVAAALAEGGAHVVITYRDDDTLAAETVKGLPGGPHLQVRADVTDTNAIRELFRIIREKFGRVDILVNNAGIFQFHRLQEGDFESWRATWDLTLSVNLTGAATMCWFAAREMMKLGGGKIINISSRGAFRGEPDSPGYGASKAGLNAMSQSLAVALAPYSIYVGVVAPGWVMTDMTEEILKSEAGRPIRDQSPLKRTASPEEVAHAVVMFAADGSEYMTGCIIDVNGASYLRS